MLGANLSMKSGLNHAFRDVLMLLLLLFVAIDILVLPWLNDPGDRLEKEADQPGNVSVEIRWGDGIDADVDLWVQAPGDQPVGYSNLGAEFFNLLRDDRGFAGEPLGLNYENAFTRGVPDGEYIVNVHLFHSRRGKPPIEVAILVSIRKPAERLRELVTRTVQLRYTGHEITVVRFRLAGGVLVEESVNANPVKLASRRSTQ